MDIFFVIADVLDIKLENLSQKPIDQLIAKSTKLKLALLRPHIKCMPKVPLCFGIQFGNY